MEKELISCLRRLNTLASGFKKVRAKRTGTITTPKSGVKIVHRNLDKIGLSVCMRI